MSARRFGQSEAALTGDLTVESQQTRLSLPPDAVIIRRNGIEFRSPTPFSPWVEMTVLLHSAAHRSEIACNGVVVACNGSRHSGYVVSMLFTGLNEQNEARLSLMADSLLA